MAALMQREMEGCYPMSVPLTVSVGTGEDVVRCALRSRAGGARGGWSDFTEGGAGRRVRRRRSWSASSAPRGAGSTLARALAGPGIVEASARASVLFPLPAGPTMPTTNGAAAGRARLARGTGSALAGRLRPPAFSVHIEPASAPCRPRP